MQLPDKFYIETGLFFGFTNRRLFQGFAVIYKSPGDSPAAGDIPPLDQDNALSFPFDDDIYRGDGIEIFLLFHSTDRTTFSYPHLASFMAFL